MDAPTLDLLPLDVPPSHAAGFDYSQLDDAAANQAKAVVERVRDRQKAYVIDTGRDLLSVKERLGHGLFLEWVEAELQISVRTAQRFMSAAEVLGDKSDTVSYLPPSILYALSASSTPAPVREKIVERIEAGEDLPAQKVEWMLHEARAKARQERVEAKVTPEQRQKQAKSKRDAEARHRRAIEQHRKEMDEDRARKKAMADELADILVPLLSEQAYSRVYDLVHHVYTADMRMALIGARGRLSAGRAASLETSGSRDD